MGFNEISEAWQNWTCPTAPCWILWQAGPDLTAEGPPEGSSTTRQSRCPPAPPLSGGGRRHVPAMSSPPSRGREAPWALPSPEGRLLPPGPGGNTNFFLWGKWVISAHPICRHEPHSRPSVWGSWWWQVEIDKEAFAVAPGSISSLFPLQLKQQCF